MPDLNSLPLSRSPSSHPQPLASTNNSDTFRPTPQTPSPLSHSPSIAFATSADTQNAGSPRRRGSPRMERRRSSMLGTWSLNDGPGMLAGTMADPHRQRAPSLGELHQELENEQEAQVNRLLGMIRAQQAQLQRYQSTAILPTNTSEESAQISPNTTAHTRPSQSRSRTPSSSRPPSTAPPSTAQSIHPHLARQASMSLSRRSSLHRTRTNSHASSPAIRPMSTEPGTFSGGLLGAPAAQRLSGADGQQTQRSDGSDWLLSGVHRDEVSLYQFQTETAMVQRENLMLKGRIRELERQLAEAGIGDGA